MVTIQKTVIKMKTNINTLVLASMLLFSSGIYAACTKKDIAGIWHANLHGVVSPLENSQHLLFRCALVVSAAGAITTRSKCDIAVPPTYAPVVVRGGLLSISNICKVSGHLILENLTVPIDKAWLNKGKDVLSGEGVLPGGWITLNAIKQ